MPLPRKRPINWEHTPYYDPVYYPVPVPGALPSDEPQACINVNESYIPYIVGALNRYTREDAWQGEDEERQIGVQKAHELIQTILDEHCPEGIPEDICEDFTPLNPFTRYAPNNPFTSPDFVPGGYLQPPFYTGVTNIIQDIRPGDVMVDLLSLPTGMTIGDIIGFSLPIIHIELSGTGECELELKSIVQGGFVTIVVDGNPIPYRTVDLNSQSLLGIGSLLGLIGVLVGSSLRSTEIVEIIFDTPGEHTIDITFFPNIGEDILIGFGGGLRRISFCSDSLDGDQRYMAISDIRVNTGSCKWEVQYNDDPTWVEIGDYYIPECLPEAAAQTLIRDPGDGQLEESLDGGDTYSDIPNAHFLHINADNDPLTGGLTINSIDTSNPSLIVIEPTSSPTVPLVSYRKSDGNPIWEILSNLRARYYGSSGNITLDQAGNDINFSRVGANFLSAITAPGTLQMRVGGLASVVAHQNGRSTYGHSEQRDATVDILSQDTTWPVLSVRGITSQSAALAEFKTSADTKTLIKANGAAEIVIRDGNINSAPDGLLINHNVGSSTPLADFGASIRIQGKDSTTDSQNMALLSAVWDTPTHASRKAKVTLSIFDTAAREVFVAAALGAVPAIGFLGASASQRVDVGTVDCAGNLGSKAALDALVNFGLIEGVINLGEDTGGSGGSAALTRSQIASRSAMFMLDLYEYNIRTFVDTLPLFGGADVLVETTCAAFMYDQTAIAEWCETADTDFSPGDTEEMDAHVATVRLYAEHFRQAIYCALDEDGCMDDGFEGTFKALIPSSVEDVQRMADFLACFGAPGYALMLSQSEIYRCDLDEDLTATECDIWEVLITTASPDIVNLTGDSDSISWFFEGSTGTLILQLPGFHVTSLSFVVQTDDDTAPAEIRVAEYGTSTWHYWTPTIGANDVEFIINAPAGIEIQVSIDSGSSEPSISVRTLNVFGIGSPIPDGG